MFRVDGVDFAFDARGVKEGFGEEACKAVEGAEKGVWRDFKSVLRKVRHGRLKTSQAYIGVANAGVCARAPAVCGEIALVVVILRILLGPEEEKMFTRVTNQLPMRSRGLAFQAGSRSNVDFRDGNVTVEKVLSNANPKASSGVSREVYRSKTGEQAVQPNLPKMKSSRLSSKSLGLFRGCLPRRPKLRICYLLDRNCSIPAFTRGHIA